MFLHSSPRAASVQYLTPKLEDRCYYSAKPAIAGFFEHVLGMLGTFAQFGQLVVLSYMIKIILIPIAKSCQQRQLFCHLRVNKSMAPKKELRIINHYTHPSTLCLESDT